MLRKSIRTFLLSMLLVLSLLPVQAMAAAVDVDAPASLQVQIAPDARPQEGVEVRLYRVADVSADCKFTLTGAFAGYSVPVNDNSAEGWRSVATTLDGYVSTDAIPADAVVETNSAGMAAFEGLSTGLYLVTGDKFYVSKLNYYTPTAFLVSLPNTDGEGKLVYDVALNAKLVPGQDEEDDRPDYTQISVLKVWDDNDSPDRPVEIVVELYDGAELYDTVTLNKENNWQYKWVRLDEDGDWIVREKEVPAGYEVSVEKQGSRYVLTNTLPDPPQTPGDPGEPDTPDEPEEPGLPQTGVLWWPVPVLLAAGLALILIGVIRRRNAYEE